MTYTADALYALLPATIRARDFDAGKPLYALLSVVAEQTGVLESNLAQSYEDLFIETCSGWAVPYIGDLVGTTPLFDSGRAAIDVTAEAYANLTGPGFTMVETLRSRADVAKTISYRRRKSTRPMLEELARDVTGWPAHVVEMFQVLRWTQCIRNHVRSGSFGTPDLRDAEALDRMGGPFDPTTRAVDVRRPTQADGWYQVPNVAFFLWRLLSLPVFDVSARPVSPGDWRYSFSPLGNPTELFAPNIGQGLSSAAQVESRLPSPIRRKALVADLFAYPSAPPQPGFTTYYGWLGGTSNAKAPPPDILPPAPFAAFTIVRDGVMVPPEQVRCIPLDKWCQPPGQVVGVDPKTGRMAFGTGFVPAQSVDVWFYQGFSAAIGGGSYDRLAWLAQRTTDTAVYVVATSQPSPGSYPSIAAAIGAWASSGLPTGVVSIADSRTYVETLNLTLPPKANLTIEAADGERPHVRLNGMLTVTGADDATLTLSGLLVEGAVHVTGPLQLLRLLHSTLVPGVTLNADGTPASSSPSLLVEQAANDQVNGGIDVAVSSSITGPLRIPGDAKSLWVADSIVDGVGTPAISGTGSTPPSYGPPTTLIRCTLFGDTVVASLEGSESLFTTPLTVQRRQDGCVRFSFLAGGSTTPRRFRCQPDLEIASEIDAKQKALGRTLTSSESDAVRAAVSAWLLPTFTSKRYGDPGYAQLGFGTPSQITTGAEDGAEMGVFAQLNQPQREENLRTRLGEYLPLGLQGFVVYVT